MAVRLLIALVVAGGATLGGVALSRWRSRRRPSQVGASIAPADLPEELVGRWAVIGFTSPLCTACKRTPDVVAAALGTTREALEEGAVDGVVFQTLDVREHPALVEQLDVRSTPTVVVLDPDGQVRSIEPSNPNPAQLGQALPTDPEEAVA